MSANKDKDIKKPFLEDDTPAVVVEGSLNGAEKTEKHSPAEKARRERMLLISFALMVVVGLGNSIMGIVQMAPMQNYPLFDNLLTTFAYLPTSLLYIIPVIKYRPDVITAEARAVPQYVWCIMGFLDSIAGLLQTFSINNLQAENQNPLIVLLKQAAIPVSMIITKYMLAAKYKGYHYAGAFFVISGLVIALVPSLVGGVGGASTVGIWSGVLVFSAVPMCLSSVFKEKKLGNVEIDAVYMNFWVAVYQMMFSLVFLVPFGYASSVTAPELPANIWNGARCYVGINSIFNTTSSGNSTALFPGLLGDGGAISSSTPDDCGTAPAYVNVYILFNLAFNILIILMLKYGSSNILWLCFTLQVPLANFAFAIPGMPGYTPVTWENGLGLVVLMTGLITYRFYPPLRALFDKYRAKRQAALAAANGGSGDDGMSQSLLGSLESPSPTISGGTPVRGLHTHVAMGKGNKSKAEALANQRQKNFEVATKQGVRGRADSK